MNNTTMLVDTIPSEANTLTSGPDCSICCSAIKPSELIRSCAHGHIFHNLCIGEWLLIKRDCPVCRTTMAPKLQAPSDVSASTPDVRAYRAASAAAEAADAVASALALTVTASAAAMASQSKAESVAKLLKYEVLAPLFRMEQALAVVTKHALAARAAAATAAAGAATAVTASAKAKEASVAAFAAESVTRLNAFSSALYPDDDDPDLIEAQASLASLSAAAAASAAYAEVNAHLAMNAAAEAEVHAEAAEAVDAYRSQLVVVAAEQQLYTSVNISDKAKWSREAIAEDAIAAAASAKKESVVAYRAAERSRVSLQCEWAEATIDAAVQSASAAWAAAAKSRLLLVASQKAVVSAQAHALVAEEIGAEYQAWVSAIQNLHLYPSNDEFKPTQKELDKAAVCQEEYEEHRNECIRDREEARREGYERSAFSRMERSIDSSY